MAVVLFGFQVFKPWAALLNPTNMEYTRTKEQEPQHDGRYLCVCKVVQPCGTTWYIEQIVERKMGAWEIGEGGAVLKWMNLPYGGWPRYEDAE